MRLAIFVAISIGLVGLGALSMFRVDPSSAALVLRGQTVQRTVRDGLHLRIPFVEKVVVEQVDWERQFPLDEPVDV